MSRQTKAYPHNLQAERALIGAVLVTPSMVPLVRDQVDDVDFYLEKHRKIWGRICAFSDASKTIDLVTLVDSFGEEVGDVGGLPYLSSLLNAAPLADNAEAYATIIKEKAIRRRLIQVGEEIRTLGLEGEGTLAEVVDAAESALLDVSGHQKVESTKPVTDVIKSSFARIEALWGKKSEITGLSTGFATLDRMLAGLHPKNLLILAARPAMGKTAFALNILANAAIRGGARGAFFSLEMGHEELGIRLICSEARVDAGKVRTGKLQENEWRRLAKAAESIYQAPIIIDDQPALSVLDLRSRCRRLQTEGGLDLVIVDYLQLMTGLGPKAHGSRELEISYISRSLKGLSKELDLPVIALSQLNRSLESRQDKRPMMSDLRESGAIEQDADVVMFIYRDAVYAKDEEGKASRAAEVIIGKQRNGPIGTAELAFIGKHTRFENIAEWG